MRARKVFDRVQISVALACSAAKAGSLKPAEVPEVKLFLPDFLRGKIRQNSRFWKKILC